MKGNLCFVVFCCLYAEDPPVVAPYCAHFLCGLVPVLLACELRVYCDCTAEGLVGFSLVFGYLGSTLCNLSMADQGILFHKLDEIIFGLFGDGACVFAFECVMAVHKLFYCLCAVSWDC